MAKIQKIAKMAKYGTIVKNCRKKPNCQFFVNICLFKENILLICLFKENILRPEELQQYWNGRIFEICEKNKFKYLVWEEAWYNGFPDEEDLGLNIKENVIIGIWKDFAQWDWARTLRN